MTHLREHGGMLYPDLRPTMEILKEKVPSLYCQQLSGGLHRGVSDHYDFPIF